MHLSNNKYKQCTSCKEWLLENLDNFSKRNKDSEAFITVCRNCRNKYWKEYYRKNKEKALEYAKNQRLKKAIELKQYHKKYYATNKEYIINREKNRYYRNREKILLRIKEKRISNKELYSLKDRVSKQKRRAREKNANGRFTADELKKLKLLQENKCLWCGVELDDKYHVDHIIPLSKGGTNYIHNLAITCSACNLSKGNKLLKDWKNRPSNNYGRLEDVSL